MVGRSNEISREICRVQDADEESSNASSEGRCSTNGPGLAARYRTPTGSERGDTGDLG